MVKTKKAIYKKLWFWLILGLFIVYFLVSFAFNKTPNKEQLIENDAQIYQFVSQSKQSNEDFLTLLKSTDDKTEIYKLAENERNHQLEYYNQLSETPISANDEYLDKAKDCIINYKIAAYYVMVYANTSETKNLSKAKGFIRYASNNLSEIEAIRTEYLKQRFTDEEIKEILEESQKPAN